MVQNPGQIISMRDPENMRLRGIKCEWHMSLNGYWDYIEIDQRNGRRGA